MSKQAGKSTIEVATMDELVHLLLSGRVKTAYMPVKLGNNLLKVAVGIQELLDEISFQRLNEWHEPNINVQFELWADGDMVVVD